MMIIIAVKKTDLLRWATGLQLADNDHFTSTDLFQYLGVLWSINPISILVLSLLFHTLSTGPLPDGWMQWSQGFRKCFFGLAAWWIPNVWWHSDSLTPLRTRKSSVMWAHLANWTSLSAKHPSCLCCVWILWQPHPLDTNQRAAGSRGCIYD